MRFVSLAVRVCAVCLLTLALGVAPAWGQAGSSTIRGTVTDPQGAVVPRATVTVTNLATNLVRTQTTSEAGTFSFELIPVGLYRVEIKADGFRTKVLNNVEALVGLPTDASVELEVGSVAEVVQVEAVSTAAQVNNQDATLGNNFVTQQISQLPLEARNVTGLLTLQPGVTGSPNAVGYVAGARSDQSNVTLDGVDINEAQSNALASNVLRLNAEAIEEFRVTTLNATANQGRSSAAQINLVTKSGTNQWHGSAFWSHRSTGFTANDFFNNRAGTPRPKLIRNVFGGSLGGPIKKDKLFFFYSYEGRTDASEEIVLQVVPLPSVGQGLLRYRDGNDTLLTLTTAQINQAITNDCGGVPGCMAAQINPAALAVLAAAAARYPANDFTVGDSRSASELSNTAGFRFNAATPKDLNSNVARIDWTINDKQTFFARWNMIYDLNGLAPRFPDTPAPNQWQHPMGGVASHNWNFSQNWVNSFRYGYTKQAFSQQGDSAANDISFRFIFSPLDFTRTLSRTTPVHNLVDDMSWIKGSHTVQFGTNIRIVRNNRNSFANAFDEAITNPSFYVAGGTVISDAIESFLATQPGFACNPADPSFDPDFVCLDSVSGAQNAVTALLGRYSQYSASFTFDRDGSLLPSGTPTVRSFATEEYDVYVQDSWKLRRNLTLAVGLRYGISRPVYERRGFEVKPTVPLGTFFEQRLKSATAGVNFIDPIVLDLSGPANNRSPWYTWDRNNLQPSIAVAWQPDFDNTWLKRFFGASGKSVLRGGFRITNDYYGQALAVNFDLNNALGFTSSDNINANTYDISTVRGRPLAPLFTGFNDDVRSLPNITIPSSLVFPRQEDSDLGARIQSSIDENLQAPINYQYSFTFERELPWGMVFQGSYIGRIGHNLLAQRDAAALSNTVDPQTGMDWYTAATMLEKIRQTRPPGTTQVPTISYFENLYGPAVFGGPMFQAMNDFYYGPHINFGDGTCSVIGVPPPDDIVDCIPNTFNSTQSFFWIARNFWGNDWTDVQFDVELCFAFQVCGNGTTGALWFQPQYGALSAWSTVGNSYYNGMTLSLRQRTRGLLWDFNYTFAHSLDDASALQADGQFSDAGFIRNPVRQRDWYASSDFDIRHQINANAIYDFPFGRGQRFGSGVNRAVDAFIGGWKLSGIFRWNTGLPVGAPYDDARWATNWNVQSNTTPIRSVSPCITKGDASTAPKFFGCNTVQAYQSFRNAYPGESGSRNIFRLPGYVTLDMGLTKAFTMPYNERHKLQLRWEVFNVTNTQRFGDLDTSRTGYGMKLDPLVRNRTPEDNWSNFTGTQKPPGANTAGRVMQIGARFSF